MRGTHRVRRVAGARPQQIALPNTPEVSESELEESEQPEVSEAPVTMPVIAEEKPNEAAPDEPEAPEETADFAMPKLSALLGDPVTPEDPDEPEQPENAEGDDGRTE